MTLKVYLALDESGAVAESILEALGDAESEGDLRRVHSIDYADAVVSSTKGVELLPDSLPESVGLLQLVDCGSGGRFAESSGLKVANVSVALTDRVALLATSQVRDAYNDMTAAGFEGPIKVGVIGVGTLGAQIVRELQSSLSDAIESIVVADIRTPRQGLLLELGVRRSTLDLLLSTSDLVVVAVHHGPTSDPLLGARELRLLGGHAWIVNVSGGGVVDASVLDANSQSAKIVDQPTIELERISEAGASEITQVVSLNLRFHSLGWDPLGLVEQVTYPSAGDPAFWSSRMSPTKFG